MTISEFQINLPERVLASSTEELDGPSPYFSAVEWMRINPKKINGYPGHPWEPWCYVPRNLIVRAVTEMRPDTDIQSPAARARLSLLAAVTAWRMTKGVYAVDPDFMGLLLDSEIPADMPQMPLLRLPEWCPYLATPGAELLPGLVIHGFFAYVDDAHWGTGRAGAPQLHFELLLDPTRCGEVYLALASRRAPDAVMLNLETATPEQKAAIGLEELRRREYLHLSLSFPLEPGGFAQAYRSSHKDLIRLGMRVSGIASPEIDEPAFSELAMMHARLAALVVWLAVDDTDVPTGARAMRDRILADELRHVRISPPQKIGVWQAGVSEGERLRQARVVH
jgi:hypothetical protein